MDRHFVLEVEKHVETFTTFPPPAPSTAENVPKVRRGLPPVNVHVRVLVVNDADAIKHSSASRN